MNFVVLFEFFLLVLFFGYLTRFLNFKFCKEKLKIISGVILDTLFIINNLIGGEMISDLDKNIEYVEVKEIFVEALKKIEKNQDDANVLNAFNLFNLLIFGS